MAWLSQHQSAMLVRMQSAFSNILHARIFCDLQLGMIQDTHSTPQVLCAMTMFAHHLASPSAMFTLVPVQLQPKVFGSLHNDSCRKQLWQEGKGGQCCLASYSSPGLLEGSETAREALKHTMLRPLPISKTALSMASRLTAGLESNDLFT